jgi:hypothetical protein
VIGTSIMPACCECQFHPADGSTRWPTRTSTTYSRYLKDIYYAEKQIYKALPKMGKAATSDKLRAAFKKHEAETEIQIERLEKVFEMLGKPARGKKCDACEGIIDEGKEIMDTPMRLLSTRVCWQPPRPSSIMDFTLRHAENLGQPAGAGSGCQAPRPDARRREENGRSAQRARRISDQYRSGLRISP